MNKIKATTFFLLVFSALFLFEGACVDHEYPLYTCPDEPIKYSTEINDIIINKCAIEGCHNGDNGADKDWTDFALFQENAKNGHVQEFVINRIMPKKGSLTQEEINAIACWVDQGAPAN